MTALRSLILFSALAGFAVPHAAVAQGIIRTLAGTDVVPAADGTPALEASIGATGVTRGPNGEIYIADIFRDVVVRIDRDGRLFRVAGNGIPTYSGDGGQAVDAGMNDSERVVFDRAGNLYITDASSHRVRRVTPAGVISTFAGTGERGFSGDGGQAASARLNFPVGLAIDGQGNVYITDSGNNRIRRVDPQGVITTIAGNGRDGFAGDGGPATQASITGYGVAVGPGNEIYIADTFNNRIRKVDAQGVITTFAGTGAAGFSGDGGQARAAALYWPYALGFDGAGNLYFSDYVNNRIRRITPQGIISTVAGSGRDGFSGIPGVATQAALNYPFSIHVDPDGTILIADTASFRALEVSPSGSIRVVAGTGRQVACPDGLPALSAVLNGPMGIGLGRDGSYYFPDAFAQVIRRVAPDGTISRIGGTGFFGFSGDGGPAVNAQVNAPEALTVDASNNVFFADTLNNRVRRINPAGAIETIAGDGTTCTLTGLLRPSGLLILPNGDLLIADTGCHRVIRVDSRGLWTNVAGAAGHSGSSGDGGVATQALLNEPSGLALDSAGNLYISDTANHRVRRIDSRGIISTFAGAGVAGFAGDNGPATSARLNRPRGLAIDNQNALIISDFENHRLRRVLNNVITTFAGDGVQRYAGDGLTATLASMYRPEGIVVDSVGHVTFADRGNNRLRQIRATPPGVTSSLPGNGNLSLTLPSGGRSERAEAVLAASFVGVAYSASADQSWIEIENPTGVMPATIRFRANAANLAPGTYRSTILLRTPTGNPTERSIAVTLNVTPASPARLNVETKSITFSYIVGGSPTANALTVSNAGGGTLNYTARVTSQTPWLTLADNTGGATPSQPGNIQVTGSPAGLGAGTYTGSVEVESAGTNERVTVPVIMTVAVLQTKLSVSEVGLTFRAVSGGGTPLPQEFAVLNLGQGSMGWTAQTRTLSGPAGWLSISSASGTVANPEDASNVAVRINHAGLAPGDYYGRIDVQSPNNTPQTVSILLNVLAANVSLPPEVRPAGLLFAGIEGGSPGSQTVRIAPLGSQPVNYTSTRSTNSGGDWFVHIPASGTVRPNQVGTIVVQPDFRNLPAGTYTGLLTLQFSDGTSQPVRVTTIVAPADTAAEVSKNGEPVAAPCTPSRLTMALTGTPSPLAVPSGQPANLEVKVLDNCTTPVTNSRPGASVTAAFTSPDPAVPLIHSKDGNWARTVQVRNQNANTVTASVTAFVALPNGRFLADQVDVQINLSSGAQIPQIASGAIANGASFQLGGAQAPGTLISILGQNLADRAEVGLGQSPLPFELAGIEVRLGDRRLPLLYAGPNQINAQIPYDLPLNTQHQLIVRRGSALSVPETLSLGPSQPAVFTQNQAGTGQGAIVNGVTNVLADGSNPVRAGDVISIYCTGLGLVNPPVTEGVAASLTVLSQTVNPVTVTIGGVSAPVQFSGIAPGFVGLYQVNAVVPAGVAAGNSVPVVLNMAGQQSPPATVAVR